MRQIVLPVAPEVCVVRVTVGLDSGLADALQRRRRTTAVRHLRAVTVAAGITLVPEGVRSLDDDTVYFSCEFGTNPGEFVDQLLEIPGVTAAYVVPDEGPPQAPSPPGNAPGASSCAPAPEAQTPRSPRSPESPARPSKE